MRNFFIVGTLLVVSALNAESVLGARAYQSREKADYVLSGKVTAVYTQETQGYSNYIVEIKVADIEKGDGIKKGDYFRAFIYQPNGKGKLSPFDDLHGHKVVPKQGQEVKIFVNRAQGRNEGVYPDWVDVLNGSD